MDPAISNAILGLGVQMQAQALLLRVLLTEIARTGGSIDKLLDPIIAAAKRGDVPMQGVDLPAAAQKQLMGRAAAYLEQFKAVIEADLAAKH